MSLFSRVRWYHALGGIAAYGVAAAGTFYLFAPAAATPAELGPLDDSKRRAVFDLNADHYDSDISLHEKLAGIVKLRQKLIGGVHGKVLEIGAGTGRNLAYYPKDAQVTLGDFSVGMLRQAEVRLNELSPDTRPSNVSLAAMDAHSLPFSNGEFDFAVDTFGLCSFDDPVKVLRELSRVVKPGGRILLLEHGRSQYGLLSDFLDKHAQAHAHKHGCYWNRDIDRLVREAGLSVLSRQTKHLDTTYVLICAPPSVSLEAAAKDTAIR